jgi:hypothetical protein
MTDFAEGRKREEGGKGADLDELKMKLWSCLSSGVKLVEEFREIMNAANHLGSSEEKSELGMYLVETVTELVEAIPWLKETLTKGTSAWIQEGKNWSNPDILKERIEHLENEKLPESASETLIRDVENRVKLVKSLRKEQKG